MYIFLEDVMIKVTFDSGITQEKLHQQKPLNDFLHCLKMHTLSIFISFELESKPQKQLHFNNTFNIIPTKILMFLFSKIIQMIILSRIQQILPIIEYFNNILKHFYRCVENMINQNQYWTKSHSRYVPNWFLSNSAKILVWWKHCSYVAVISINELVWSFCKRPNDCIYP